MTLATRSASTTPSFGASPMVYGFMMTISAAATSTSVSGTALARMSAASCGLLIE